MTQTGESFPPDSELIPEFDSLFRLFDSIKGEHGVIYISTPITSGKSYIGLEQKFSGTELMLAQESVVRAHKKEAASLARWLRGTYKALVVNPAEMPDQPGWCQDDYRAFWAAFIDRYCETIYFISDWEYSKGCCYEFLVSVKGHRRALDQLGNPLTVDAGTRRISRAIHDYDQASMDSTFLRCVLDRLTSVTDKETTSDVGTPRSMVTTKEEMYELYHAGKFGNRLLTWKSVEEYKASNFDRPVVLRYKGAAGGGWIAYEVLPAEVDTTINKWISQGANPRLITVNESAPDTDLQLQGEVMRSVEHLSLRYSTAKLPMRKALSEEQRHADGVEALLILQAAIDPASYDDLQELLDRYEDAVVEFSTWSRDVGVVPRRNTVYWEVRHY